MERMGRLNKNDLSLAKVKEVWKNIERMPNGGHNSVAFIKFITLSTNTG